MGESWPKLLRQVFQKYHWKNIRRYFGSIGLNFSISMRGREKSKSCVSVAITLGAGEKKVLCYFIQPETTSHLLFLKTRIWRKPTKIVPFKIWKQKTNGGWSIFYLVSSPGLVSCPPIESQDWIQRCRL